MKIEIPLINNNPYASWIVRAADRIADKSDDEPLSNTEAEALIEYLHGPIADLCPECGLSDGHKILCKTGNQKAKAYQDKLEQKARKQ